MQTYWKHPRGYLALAGIVASLAVGMSLERWRQPTAAAKDVKDTYQFFDTLVDLRAQILHNYVEKVDEQKLLDGAIRGMMSELDPYSNYFTKEELNSFDRQTHGQFSGIGAEMSMDPQTNHFIIVSPLEDSPALKAGILAGDRLIKVNGEVLDGMNLPDLTKRVAGPPGTEVKLTVVHEGEKTPVEITVKRDVVTVHSIKGYKRDDAGGWDFMIDPEHRIAYVRITNFMDSTAVDLDKALKPLLASREGLKGIVLDLRFNPGGLLRTGVEVADRFLESGVVVSIRKPEGKEVEAYSAKADGTYPRVPLVVLINEYSASAAEIVAGALKDHRRAVLIGNRTFGKGSVQNLITIDSGNAALKLTTHYYYLPSGRNIAKKKDSKTWGVEPDPVFQMPLTDAENKAIALARSRSEVIRIKRPTTLPVAGGNTATAPATVPATVPSTAPATGTRPATAPGASTQNGEPADRQLARAIEVLVANQMFSGERAKPEVSTTRAEATATIGTQPGETPAETRPEKPETQPESRPETRPETRPESQPESRPGTPPESQPESKPEPKPETNPAE